MFTNEFDFDSTTTTILDETGEQEDVEVVIDDDGVLIRQYVEDFGWYDAIYLTHKMFKDMIESTNHPEGFFQTRYDK